MEEFNKRLAYLFDKYSLTASTFADKIGVQRSSLSHIISGRNKPSLDFILKIYDAFPDINLPWLTLGEGEFSKSTILTTSTPNDFVLIKEEETMEQDLAKVPDEENKMEAQDLFSGSDEYQNLDISEEKNVQEQNVYSEIKIENDVQEKDIYTKNDFSNVSQTLDNSEIEQVMIFYKDGTFKTFRQR